ncbi:MAG TPA: PP2C family serine/threonine-protein phosphatase [Polyangia bacterium]|nr:PP2C family serine/threonine-protein phosphatase [Polyangia bacterium]
MGTSHVKSGDPCQDAGACEVVDGPDGSDVLIAVACDGAGSAKLSQIGSAETCRFTVQRIKELMKSGLPVVDITQEVATRVVLEAQDNLRATAESAGATARDLACTLVAGIIAPDAAAFFQVGDGVAIVGQRDEPVNEFCWVFWPERGEYANTTTFLSEDRVAEHLKYDVVRRGIDEVALLTDGIQALVLDYKGHAAHAPFFSRMMAPLRARQDAGHIGSLSSALAVYLDSPPINDRTDDDKTLILACRRTTDDE